MANKWKYSTLSADERIGRIKNGDKDVYESEVARSLDVISSRQKAGLDVSEQKAWIDKVSYNYNLSNAKNMGVDAGSVSKTGYADALLTGSAAKSGSSSGIKTLATRFTVFSEQARKLYDDFLEKAERAESGRAYAEEWLVNNGIAPDSGEGKKYMENFEAELSAAIQKLNSDYQSKLKALASKYGYKY